MGLIRLEPRVECGRDQRCRTAAVSAQCSINLVSFLDPPVALLSLTALSKHFLNRWLFGGGKKHPFFSVLRAGEAEPRSWLRYHLET